MEKRNVNNKVTKSPLRDLNATLKKPQGDTK